MDAERGSKWLIHRKDVEWKELMAWRRALNPHVEKALKKEMNNLTRDRVKLWIIIIATLWKEKINKFQ